MLNELLAGGRAALEVRLPLRDRWARSAGLLLSAVILGLTLAAAATGTQDAGARVTFSGDVAPILFDRCVQCHNPDGSAPFSLASYDDARSRAALIGQVTARREMPPWKTAPDSEEFVGQKTLNDDEIAIIQAWVAGGAPEGDPRELPTPTWRRGWQLGEPDLVVTLPKAYILPATGSDVWRIFVFPVPIDGVRYVRGLEFRPEPAAVVHHARIRIDPTPASYELDARDPAPGYEGLILRSATYPEGHFLGWTPGQAGPLVPDELAWRLDPGAHLVVELHMLPSGKPHRVAPAIGLFFSDTPPRRKATILRLGRQDLDIPPGEKAYVSQDSFVLPVDAHLLAVQPHAHFRGREIFASATLPGGTSRTLLHIEDWDVRWQHFYQYVTPIALPSGTRLEVRLTFDNSAENPRNPQLPPRRVFWGEEATSEMGELWLQLLPHRDRELQRLNADINRKMATEDVTGYEARLNRDPSKIQLHDQAADTYLYLGRAAEAVSHFRASLRHKPRNASAHYNLGIALSEAGELNEAIGHFRRAIELEPDYGRAHNNLGSALARLGRIDEALPHYEEALRLEERDPDAHYNAGTILRVRGETRRALGHFRRALALRPDWVPAIVNLAWLLATLPDASDRDPADAVRLAEHAADRTDRRDATILDVLAAAYASAGWFDRAVATVVEALALQPPAHVAAAIRQRQALYENGMPFRIVPVR